VLFDTVYYKKRVDHTDLVTCAEQCIGENEIMPDTDLLYLLMSEHHGRCQTMQLLLPNFI